jgi:hypothetical protein
VSLSPEAMRGIIERAVEYGVQLADREHRRAQVRERVKWYLSERPDASGNEVYRAVGKGSAKSWTLEALRELRPDQTGNESSSGSRRSDDGGLNPDRLRIVSPEEWLADLYSEAGS